MSEQSSSAPAPSKHIFLHELSKQPPGSKVRFLCCTLDYEVTKGRLLVEHAYPRDAVPVPRAYVNVDLVLEAATEGLLQNGAWLNVIGYVKGGQSVSTKRKRPDSTVTANHGEILVQAVLIWDAGPIDAGMYEKTIEMQRQAWKDTRNLHRVD